MKALLCLLLFVAPVSADQASLNAKIDELLRVTDMEQMMPRMTQQIMGQMQAMMTSQAQKMNLPADGAPRREEIQKRVMAVVAEKMTWERLKPMYVKIYAETYTEDEITGIIAFYKTPAGQAMLKKTPALTQNMMQSMQGIMGEMMAEIPHILEDMKKQN